MGVFIGVGAAVVGLLSLGIGVAVWVSADESAATIGASAATSLGDATPNQPDVTQPASLNEDAPQSLTTDVPFRNDAIEPAEPVLPADVETPTTDPLAEGGIEQMVVLVTVSPDHVSASSELESGSAAYTATRAFDGDVETAWSEGAPGSGRGQWVEARFDRTQRVRRIRMTTGFTKVHHRSGDLFYLNAHLRRARLIFSTGEERVFDVGEHEREVTIGQLNLLTTSVRIVVDDVWSGTRWEDLAITEIWIQAEESSSGTPSASAPTPTPSRALGQTLAAEDEEFIDSRGGWGWSDRCYRHLQASRVRYAHGACARGLEVARDPRTRGALLYNMGMVAEAEGDPAAARRHYRESLRERPGNRTVQSRLDSLP